MGVKSLDHFNVTAPPELLERVRDFYCEALGLTVGERPGFSRRGFWLYAGGAPLVHLTAARAEDARDPHARAHLDHVAFSCEGLQEFVARLERAGVGYTLDEIPALGQTQLFLRDPAGVGLELNFTGESPAREDSA